MFGKKHPKMKGKKMLDNRELNALAAETNFKYRTLAKKVLENSVPRNFLELDIILLEDAYVILKEDTSALFEFDAKFYLALFKTMNKIVTADNNLFYSTTVAQGAILEFYLTPFTNNAAFPKIRRILETTSITDVRSFRDRVQNLAYEIENFQVVSDKFRLRFGYFAKLVDAFTRFRFDEL